MRSSRAVSLVTRLAAGMALLGAVGCAGPSASEQGPTRLPETIAVERVANALNANRSLTSVPLRETTPEGLWEGIATQTFRITDDFYEDESFALTNTETVQLGSGYGGPGIVFTLVEDLDGDGKVDLGYVTGSGSGVKRYNIGVLDRPGYSPANSETNQPAVTASLRQRGVDFEYRDPVELRVTGGRVEVYDPARRVLLGTLRLTDDAAVFEPARDLPLHVRRRFLRPQL